MLVLAWETWEYIGPYSFYVERGFVVFGNVYSKSVELGSDETFSHGIGEPKLAGSVDCGQLLCLWNAGTFK